MEVFSTMTEEWSNYIVVEMSRNLLHAWKAFF